AVQPDAQAADMVLGPTVTGFETDGNIRVSGANEPAVAVTETDARGRNSNVVEDTCDFVARHFRANGSFEFLDELSRFFDASAGSSAQVESKTAGIHIRKEILAELRNDQPRTDTKEDKTNRKSS